MPFALDVAAPLAAVPLITPLFAAAGALLAGIPIIIHLLNRRRFRSVPWAAMNFLLAALKKNRRRLRFEQWLLMAVRCAVLALFGLALARPVSCDQSNWAAAAGQRSALHVIVIDNSYSMAYQTQRPGAATNLDQARRLAGELIGRLSSGESVAIITASRPAVIVINATFNLDAARAALGKIRQSYGGTDLAGALMLAEHIGHDPTARSPLRVLQIFTDSTRSAFDPAHASQLQTAARPLADLYRLELFDVAPAGQSNRAVEALDLGQRLIRSDFDTALQATIHSYGGAGSVDLHWTLDKHPMPVDGGMFTPTPDSPPRVFSQANFKQGGTHLIAVTCGNADRLPADDTRYRVVDVAANLRVLIVEGSRGVGKLAGSAAFLSLALSPPADPALPQSSGVNSNSYVQPETISDLELGNKALSDYRALILAGVAQLSETQADQVQSFVKSGGLLLVFMGEAVDGVAYNRILLPRGLMPGTLESRATAAADQKSFLFDFNPAGALHPLLAAFKNQEKTGLETAPVYTYWKIALNDPEKVQRVLDFQPGKNGGRDPAIVETSCGDGRVIFIATSANWEWNALPAKPAYVALMHELLSGGVTPNDGWLNLEVGQALDVPPRWSSGNAPVLKDAQQRLVPLLPATGLDGALHYRSGELTEPGAYDLTAGGQSFPVAVNVPDDEADVRPLSPPAVAAALGNISLAQYGAELPPLNDGDREGADFGRGVLFIVMSALALECGLAWRFSHGRR